MTRHKKARFRGRQKRKIRNPKRLYHRRDNVVKFIDLTGQKFGRLTAISHQGSDKSRAAMWKCQCECGGDVITRASSLHNGNTQSCGCLHKERIADASKTHGLSGGRNHTTRLYRIWSNMKSRCLNPKANRYKNYGGRGISICPEWMDFKTFYDWATSSGYQDDLTIDRKDNNGNYEPGNCAWVSPKQQNLNKRDNHHVTFNGETKTIQEWCKVLNMKYSTLKARLMDYKWSVESAFLTPVQRRTQSGN